MSASNNPTLHPIFFKAKAILVANVDFPTPPLALEIAIVNFVPLMGFLHRIFHSFSFALRHLIQVFLLA